MIKVVTFNIRCDYGQDGENRFEMRRPLITNKIESECQDIICFQEVVPHVAVWLKENLIDYYVAGCGRSKELDNEQMTIAFRKDRMNLIAMETFWLSPDCREPGSRYSMQSDCPRACTEMVLQDMENGKAFRIVNIHLDHLGAEARKLGLKQILQKMDETRIFPGIPVILAGDLNAEPGTDEMKVLEERPDYKNITQGIGITFHGFLAEETPMQIDYIYLSNPADDETPYKKSALKCISVEKWVDRENGVWLSDHYPVCVCMEWKK